MQKIAMRSPKSEKVNPGSRPAFIAAAKRKLIGWKYIFADSGFPLKGLE
ncbi:MAG TPA: hypothetical protein PKG90_14590 [Chitinophagaceae bacterium]|nr:hypothetical protein [Chitinophagaceae bacterium]HNU13516.1 hypothetical protein [Chitinophagaceae bacterium]